MAPLRFLHVIGLSAILLIAGLVSLVPAHAQSGDEFAALTAQMIQLHEAGKYTEAIAIGQRALAMAESRHGPDHPLVGTALNNLGMAYRAQGRFAEAEPVYKRYLGIREKTLGPDHPNVATALNNLALLYKTQGRIREAERLYKRSLEIREKALGPDHPQVGTSLGNLGLLYHAEGRYAEAEPLAKRDLAIREKAPGADQLDLSRALNNLALMYDAQSRHAEAEPLYKRALAITEAKLGPEHPDVGTTLNNLAVVYAKQRRYAEAEPLTLRALSISEKQLGPDHPSVGLALNNLAALYHDQARYADAERLYLRSATAFEKSSGPSHPQVGVVLTNVGMLRFLQSDWQGAIDYLERSTGIAIARFNVSGDSADLNPAGGGREVVRSSRALAMMIRAAARLAADKPDREPKLRSRMFEIAQWTQESEAAASLAQMAARQAKGGGVLARLVRERQDLAAEWQAGDKALLSSRAQPPERRNREAEAALRARLAKIDARVAEIDKVLAKDFPEFAVLTNSAPIDIREVQAHLHPGEALVLLLDTSAEKPMPEETFLWVVTSTDARWVRSPLGTKALTERVAALRCGLDLTLWLSDDSQKRCRDLLKALPAEQIISGRRMPVLPFDLQRAHELYAALLGPVEDLIKGKNLLIVPSGPLTALPFQALVAEKPSRAIPADVADYADAAWLAKRHAITVLPSVASLKALRRTAKASKATQPFIGFGNPLLLGPDGRDRRAWERQTCKASPASVQIANRGANRGVRGSIPKFFGGGLANVEEVRAQYPLPETADELCTVAKSIGARDGAVYLGDKSSETTIKALSANGTLAQARVVHFATHGLLAGETETLAGSKAEPALILTPPQTATEEDDGLLTASEIAQLKLDADWVVLSACNTAAGETDKPGAQALSGLARAFFYAGARALLVSHWAVNSEATVKLITKAFDELKADPGLGRAEALRRSMLTLIGTGGAYAHPANWAPFVVVGEGAR